MERRDQENDGRIVQVKESRTRDGGRLILVTDVTELRRTTAALQKRVERARTLNHLAQLISSSPDLETVLSEIARAASALLGRSARVLPGPSISTRPRSSRTPTSPRI